MLNDFAQHLLQEQRLSSLTVQTYLRLVKAGLQFQEASRGENRLATESFFYSWAAHLRRQQGLAERSIALYMAALKRYFSWKAERHGEVFSLGKLKLAPPKRRIPRVLTPDQVLALLNFEPRCALDWRDQAMLESFYSSGFRLHELAQLQVPDLQWEEGLVRVKGKGAKVRWIPIGRQALRAIEQWLKLRAKPTTNLIFTSLAGGPLSHRAIQKRVVYWTQRQLGLELYPHALRHTLATHLLSASQDLRAVQEILGHAKLSTTQGYTHLDMDTLTQRYDEAHPKQARCRKNFFDKKM